MQKMLKRKNFYENDLKGVLLSERAIKKRIRQLGALISKDYKGKNLLVIGVLNGAAVFLSDLIREITIPLEIDFVSASSYGKNSISSGKVALEEKTKIDPSGRDILLVEDILDSGLTLSVIRRVFTNKKASSVRVCVLLDKPTRRTVPLEPHYRGFTVPDEFLVGYGLDYNEKYRNLPFIGVVEPKKV